MGGSLASVHSIAEDNFIFSLIQHSSEKTQDQRELSNLGHGHEPSSQGRDSEYRRTWLGALIWLQWEWEDGTAWDYHNWNKGEVAISILLAFTQLDSETSNAGEGFGDIGLCVFLGDESGDNEVQMWTEGVFASNRTDFNCICNKSC